MRQFHRSVLVILGLMLIVIANPATAAGPGNTIVVRLLGTADSYSSNDLFAQYGVTGPESLCWDFDLLDAKTGDIIGYASDCAVVIGVVGDGLQALGTTFFFLPGGTVASRVYTTVQPLTHGSPGYTHITGAVPALNANNVIYGDGKFKGAAGRVRFSGIGDFTLVNPFTGGTLSADCLYTLDIETGN